MRLVYKRRNWFSRNWIFLVVIFIGLLFVNIFAFVPAFQGPTIDAENASQYGSFLAGYAGTLLSLISVVLLILTFRDQREKSQVENFTSRFFEVVKLHRDNVSEIGIHSNFGKRVFVTMFREFRKLLEVVHFENKKNSYGFTDVEVGGISYQIFYYGVGPNSTRVLLSSVEVKFRPLVEAVIPRISSDEFKGNAQSQIGLSYTPFEGHQSRLGHYFRHLYTSVKFVDDSSLDIDKYEIVKILRVQLSNHEQAFLLFNCLSVLGRKWLAEDLISKYQLIKNIPRDFMNSETEIDVKKAFPDVTFEWEEELKEINLTSSSI